MKAPINLRVETYPYLHLRDDEGCVLASDYQDAEKMEFIVKAVEEYKLFHNTNEIETTNNNKYEVWITQGQGGVLDSEFDTLDEALIYAKKGIENKEGSFAIKYPNGEMYKWK